MSLMLILMPHLTEVMLWAGLKSWCREGELNPQGAKAPADFESAASQR